MVSGSTGTGRGRGFGAGPVVFSGDAAVSEMDGANADGPWPGDVGETGAEDGDDSDADDIDGAAVVETEVFTGGGLYIGGLKVTAGEVVDVATRKGSFRPTQAGARGGRLHRNRIGR